MLNDNLPHISIIMLNWNGWRDTIECLESLYQINYPNYNVILVDNNSIDDSIEKIKSYCQGDIKVSSPYLEFTSENKPIHLFEYTKDQVENKLDNTVIFKMKNLKANNKLTLIIQEKNTKFSGGTNLGIKFCLENLPTDYYMLLNNDMVFEKNFLMELIEFAQLENNRKVGILHPRICLYDAPEINQWKGIQDINVPFEMNEASGAAFLIKSEVIKKIGYLDRRFGIYHEDVDFCFRAQKVGYKIYYIPTNHKILHKGSGITKTIKGFRTYYSTRNRLILNVKHRSHSAFLLYFIKYLFRTLHNLWELPKPIRKFAIKGLYKGLKLILLDRTLLLHQGYKNFLYYNEYNTKLN